MVEGIMAAHQIALSLVSGKVDEKATQLHAIASLKVLLDATKPQDGVNGNADGLHSAEGGDSGRATGSEVLSKFQRCL